MDHELFCHSVNTDQFSTLLDIFALLPFSTHSLNKDHGTTHWVPKIFLRTAVCVAILAATLYQKPLEVGMNCIYQSDIWIYPMQICMTKCHILMLYPDSCFRLSTSWFWCRHQEKTSTKTSTDIYWWKKYPYLKLQDYRICSSGLQSGVKVN